MCRRSCPTPSASTTAAANTRTRMLDVLRAKLFIHLERTAKDATEDLRQPLGGYAGPGLFHRQMRFGQDRPCGEPFACNKALVEDGAQRGHVARHRILVDRVGAHFLDEADPVNQLAELLD